MKYPLYWKTSKGKHHRMSDLFCVYNRFFNWLYMFQIKKAYFLKHEPTAVSMAPAKIKKSPILKTILRNFSGPKLKWT